MSAAGTPRRMAALLLAAGATLLGALLLATPASAVYFMAGSWGGAGAGVGQFNAPAGVAIDSGGGVYVVDSGNARVQVFNPQGAFIRQWGGAGSEPGEFVSPRGIAIGPLGNVYVADTGNNRIQVFNLNGDPVDQWPEAAMDDPFTAPQGVATDASGSVYVADSGNHRIVKLTSAGELELEWGAQGVGNTEFATPRGIATDSAGDVYVVDSGNARVQRYSSDGIFKSPSMRQVCWSICVPFSDPRFAATVPSGDLFVTDIDAVMLLNLVGPGRDDRFGLAGAGRVSDPQGIAISSVGRVYVANRGNHRVQWYLDDRTPPRVRILRGPRGKTKRRRAVFRFRSNEPGSKFRCKLDRRRFRPCRSPRVYRKLRRGKHVFRVRAIDRAGNVSRVARRSWRVVR